MRFYPTYLTLWFTIILFLMAPNWKTWIVAVLIVLSMIHRKEL